MRFGKCGSLLLSGVILCGAAGAFGACSSGTSALAQEMFGYGDEYYANVESRYTLNYDEMLYDDFTGDTIDSSKWVISDSVWDQWGTDQNGVRPQNLFLVKDENNPDTHLIMRANGAYYSGDALSDSVNGVNTGAGISTIEAMGPGRYEVKMKACPRVGALTSMWLFSWFNLNDGSVQQNEIDIELGLAPQFDVASFTTWTAPANNSSFNIPVDYFVNDGNWHIYTFDWVTDADVPYVDYFIDGELIYTIDTNVPTTNATLTLGVWVPSWAGGGITDPVYNVATNSRMFDSDYAEFSWWRYIPFQMDGWEQRPVANRNYAEGYEVEVLTEMPVANKVANGSFTFEDDYYYKTLVQARDELPVQIAELQKDLESAGSDAEREEINAQIVNLTAVLKSVNDMLSTDNSPWKDYTVTDPDDEFYVSAESFAGRVTDPDNAENFVAKIVDGGSYGQWLRGASHGFRYRLTLKFRTEGDAKACFRYTHYNGYSTQSRSNGSTTLELGSSAEWKEVTLEITIDKEDTRGIRYYLECLNESGTCYFDDVVLVYLGN